MGKALQLFSLFLALAAIVFTSIYLSIRAGRGLVHFFSRSGIEVDFTILVIVLGLIPSFWIISLIIKVWTAK